MTLGTYGLMQNQQKQPPEVFYIKSGSKNFLIFIRKHVQKSLFNKVACLKACNFTKKRLQHRCFPMNIANFLRSHSLKNSCERLLLNHY